MIRRRSLRQFVLGVYLAVALAPYALARPAQDQDPAPPAAPADTPDTTPAAAPAPAPASSNDDFESITLPSQQYTDPNGRFGFVAPARWGRLPSSTADEVVFESDDGDTISVSVQPLKVDPKAFASAYVDTYLKVLAQSFTDVKFIGQREVSLNFRKATDYVFSAQVGDAPATLHQVVLLGANKVLYLTFAGLGKLRNQNEQLFHSTVQSLWVSSAFGGTTTAALADPEAPSYVLAIPEGWVDQGPGDGMSHMFRPPNARLTAAFISTRVTKLPPTDPHSAVDEGFITAYAQTVQSQHAEGMFEMRQTRRIFLGGEPAVRYDYTYVSNIGIRRAVLVLCVRKGYLVGISCDSAEQSYGMYGQAFETLVNGFKFKA